MRKLLFVLFAVAVSVTRAYDFIGNSPIRWPAGPVEMVLQLDDTREPIFLLDGKSSWDEVAREALAVWNPELTAIEFTSTSGPGHTDGNERNEVFFSPRIYGHRFGRDVLAVTTTWYIGSKRIEGDVIFNDAIDWDSYRGDLQFDVLDLRRVAIHEFGHVVGLDHPDQAKQVAPAIMNAVVSDLDTLADDDIRGARALYADPGTRYVVNIDIAPEGSGTVVPNFTAPDGKYSQGTLLTLKPLPGPGFRFNFWEAPDPSSSRLLKVRVYEDQTVRAHFVSNAAPRIVVQPKSQFASRDGTVVFRVSAVNAPKASYQWYFNGVELFGATQATLTLHDLTRDGSGLYYAVVRSTKGETRSRAARLVVDGY